MDEDKMIITTDDGQEKEMIIKLKFESEEFGKTYFIFTDPTDEEGQCFAMSADDKGNLFAIEDEKEWEMVEEVFGALEDDEQA